MKQYWNSLKSQERIYVFIGAAVIFLFLIYFCMWAPFISRINQLKHGVVAQQELVNWMRQYKPELIQLRQMQPIIKQQANKSLLSTVEDSLREKSISVSKYNVQQTKSDEVQVIFSTVTFDALVNWVSNLWHSSGIVIQQITINPIEKAGFVKASVVLTKG